MLGTWTYGCDARGVGFDACDACLFGFADHLRSDVLVQIERHEVVDIRLDSAEAVTVFQRCLDGCDRRDKVGLKQESIIAVC